MLVKKFFKTKHEAEVTFSISQECAESVLLMADFAQWQPTPMKLDKKAGMFKAKVRLPINQQFYFRYLVNDQQWLNDPEADGYIANDFGSENSIVHTHFN